MKLKRWIGIMSIAFGCGVGVIGLTVDAATSYVGDEMSISDGLMVYRKVTARDGSGFVGIGMTDPKEYLLPTTPNLGIVGSMRIHGSFSSGENYNNSNTVDWRKGNNQRLDINGAGTQIINFLNPPQGSAILTLSLRYTAVANGSFFTWQTAGVVQSPPGVIWPLGELPIMSSSLTGSDRIDTVFFFYDANRRVYYGVRSYGKH